MKNTKKQPSYCVLIPTYNRPKELKKLIRQINACEVDVKIMVFDDGSDCNYSNLDVFSYYKFNKNHGKMEFWKVIGKAFNSIPEADYYYMIGDDMEILPNFFTESVEIWKKIRDRKKICLNLMVDDRQHCWTRFLRVDKGHVWLTQWNDLCFLAERKFFDEINPIHSIPKLRWVQEPKRGSGVGQQVSQRLYKSGFNMYQVKESLVTHGDHESVMHPEIRKNTPIISK